MSSKPMPDTSIAAMAGRLAEAERLRAPIDPLTVTCEGITVADAYRVQLGNVERRLRAGRRVVGHKVGLTSAAMQRMLGVDEPDFGHILDDMLIASGATCAAGELLLPRAEPEIAFVLARELRGPGVTRSDVIAATEYVTPAIEIIDTRIRDWRIKLADTIADNGSAARVVLGDARTRADACDLRLVGMVLEKNGALMETGAGAAALGHPAEAVAWLANKLAEFEQKLSGGSIVMPGALCRAIDVCAGDEITANFDRLGAVRVRFV